MALLECKAEYADGNRAARPIIVSFTVKMYSRMVVSGLVAAAALVAAAGGEMVCVTTDGRSAFLRGEAPASVRLKVKNDSKVALTGVRATVEQFVDKSCLRKQDVALGDLPAGAETVVPCAVETRIRPGWHSLRVTVTGCRDGQPSLMLQLGKHDVRIGIGPAAPARTPAPRRISSFRSSWARI